MTDLTTRFGQLCERLQAAHGDKFDASDLNPNFVNAYNRGVNYRVKVRFPDGSHTWGHVGVTGGWRPCFLLMRTRVQRWSHDTLGEGCVIVDSKVVR